AELRSRRFVQIAGFASVGVAVRIVTSIYNREWLVVGVLIVGLAAVLCSLVLNKRRRWHANPLLLVSLVMMLAFLAWISEGVYDSALFAFPCLLIMAGLLLRPRHYFGLFSLILLSVVAIGYAGLAGWHVFEHTGDPVNRL